MKGILLCSLMCVISLATLYPAKRVIRVGAYETEPLIILDETAQPKGIVVDILSKIAKDEDWKIEYVVGTWPETLARLRAGEIDLQPAIGITPARSNEFHFSREILVHTWGTIYTARGTTCENLFALSGKKVAVLRKGLISEKFRELAKEFKIPVTYVFADTQHEILERTQNRNVFAGVVNRTMGEYNESVYRIDPTPVIFGSIHLAFGVLKGTNAALLETIDTHLSEMKHANDSVYHRAMKKWFNPHEQEALPPWVVATLLTLFAAGLFFAVNAVFLNDQVKRHTGTLRAKNSELEETLMILKGVFEAIPDYVAVHDRTYRIIMSNWRGYEDVPEDVRETLPVCYEIFHHRSTPCANCEIAAVIETGHILSQEVTEQETGRVFERVMFPIRNHEGEIALIAETQRDITRQITREKAIETLNTRLEQAMLVGNLAWWEWNFVTNEVVSSERKALMLGYRPEEFPRDVYELAALIHTDDYDASMDAMRAHLKGETDAYSVEYRCRRKDGRYQWMYDKGEVTEWHADGKPKKIVGVVFDINDKKQYEESLKRYARDLEEANREVQDFTYIVSHDLRSPLISIKGFADELSYAIEDVKMLMSEPDEEARRERLLPLFEEEIPTAISYITHSIGKLDTLVNSILQLSRIGKKKVHYEKIDMNTLVASALDRVRYQIKKTNTRIEVGPLPIVISDMTSLDLVLRNLLDNAMKYLRKDVNGYIKIWGTRAPSFIEYSIQDNGRGIREEDIPKIFMIFRRAGQQDVKGNGVGLNYVKTALKKLGGDIRCESEVGKGTCFTFTLPIASETDDDRRDEMAESDGKADEKVMTLAAPS